MPTIQKASFLKRISAVLLDFILVVILATGFAAIVSAVIGYDTHTKQLDTYYKEYQTKYEVNFDITEEEFNALDSEQQQIHLDKIAAAEAEMEKDVRVLAVYETIMSLTFVIVGISGLLSILIVYYVGPLFFKNGQTVGKKIFGLAVIRSNCVKATNKVLLIRTVFGLYAIEIMFPLCLVLLIYFGQLGLPGTIAVLGLLVLQCWTMISSKTNSCIHDLLSDTVVVDFASQRIFETQEDLIAFIEEEKAREAAATPVY